MTHVWGHVVIGHLSQTELAKSRVQQSPKHKMTVRIMENIMCAVKKYFVGFATNTASSTLTHPQLRLALQHDWPLRLVPWLRSVWLALPDFWPLPLARWFHIVSQLSVARCFILATSSEAAGVVESTPIVIAGNGYFGCCGDGSIAGQQNRGAVVGKPLTVGLMSMSSAWSMTATRNTSIECEGTTDGVQHDIRHATLPRKK